jgi:hypothetical protein
MIPKDELKNVEDGWDYSSADVYKQVVVVWQS